MNRGKQTIVPAIGGYTIIEVMIFLAVSGLMFVSAMVLIGGQQNRAQFVNSVRDFESELNDIANNVATGYYIKGGDFKCVIGGDGNVSFPEGQTAGIGENEACIYVGTVIKFGNDNQRDSYHLMTMAGLRTTDGSTNVANLAEAQPKVVVHGPQGMNEDNLIVHKRLTYGNTIQCVKIGDNPDCLVNPNAAVGFFTTFTGTPSNPGNGSIQADLLYYSTVNFDYDMMNTVPVINSTNYKVLGSMRPNSITICMKSGATNQYALLKLGGGSASNLTVSTEIKNISGSTPQCS